MPTFGDDETVEPRVMITGTARMRIPMRVYHTRETTDARERRVSIKRESRRVPVCG